MCGAALHPGAITAEVATALQDAGHDTARLAARAPHLTRHVTEEGWLDPQAILFSSPTRYRPGRNYREQWNTAVFGPSFPPARW